MRYESLPMRSMCRGCPPFRPKQELRHTRDYSKTSVVTHMRLDVGYIYWIPVERFVCSDEKALLQLLEDVLGRLEADVIHFLCR